jgi:hypothetical protein
MFHQLDFDGSGRIVDVARGTRVIQAIVAMMPARTEVLKKTCA